MKNVYFFLIVFLFAPYCFAQQILHKGKHNLEVAHCQEQHRQSPINIRGVKKKKYTVDFQYVESHEVVLNEGHTVKLFYDKGSKIIFEGKTFNLIQFHFHTPSEHYVKKKKHDMEVHLVHLSSDSTLLVVSVLFKKGKENPFLKSFIDDIPKNKDEKTQNPKPINLMSFLPTNKQFYTYSGSLTTPPYTEGVRWLIFKQNAEASAAQIDIMRGVEGFNSREKQKLNHREVDEID